jgi:hypothetical protein
MTVEMCMRGPQYRESGDFTLYFDIAFKNFLFNTGTVLSLRMGGML